MFAHRATARLARSLSLATTVTPPSKRLRSTFSIVWRAHDPAPRDQVLHRRRPGPSHRQGRGEMPVPRGGDPERIPRLLRLGTGRPEEPLSAMWGSGTFLYARCADSPGAVPEGPVSPEVHTQGAGVRLLPPLVNSVISSPARRPPAPRPGAGHHLASPRSRVPPRPPARTHRPATRTGPRPTSRRRCSPRTAPRTR